MRDGWIETPIGDVAKVLSGFAFKSELFNKSEGIPLIRIRDLPKRDSTEALYSGSYEDRYIVKKGDFLIGMDGEFHCYEWNGPDALLNQRVCRIQDFKIGRVVPRYIYFSVNQYLDKIEQDTGYTTVKHISAKQVLGITIPLPPLPEQKRIVDLISSVDSYIEALQQQLESAKRSRNAVLHELLTAGGEGWVETTLGDICTDGLFADGDWVESKDQDPGGEYRLLQLADIGDGTFLNKSDRWMNREQFSRLRCTKLEVNDVLIARMPDPIGRACLFPEGLPTCATVVDVAIVRTGNETLQKFLALLINSSDFRTQAFSLLTGTTRQRISRGNLAKIAFAIPSTEKQLEIVNLISLFDSGIAQSIRVIEETKKLRSGLLSDLLSGAHEIPSSYDKIIGAA